MLIESVENKKIKYIMKLKQKKYRDSEGKFIVETLNLIKEAHLSKVLEEVYVLEGEILPFDVNCPVNHITDKVMNKIKNINTSSFIGIVRKENKLNQNGKKYLMLDKISDPGNLGTIIRSAVAFSVDKIILSPDCCDVYNDKTIRASEGAIFKINIIKEDLVKAINKLKNQNIPIYGTDVRNGIDVRNINNNSFCVVMGNEGNGISEKVKQIIDKNIYIKTSTVESLNVGVATSIILYELSNK